MITDGQAKSTHDFLGMLQSNESRLETFNKRDDDITKSTRDFADIVVQKPQGRQAPVPWEYNKSEYVRHFMGASYVAIGAIARKVAMQQVLVSVKKDGAKGSDLFPVKGSHVLRDLFDHVNDIFTQFDLWFFTTGWLYTTGDSYWWKVKNGFNVPAELWVVPSQWVRVIPSRQKYIEAYEVRSMFQATKVIPFDEVIHLREPNLNWAQSGRFYGAPAMAAGGTMVDIEESLLKRLKHAFENFAPPGLHFSTDQELTEDQVGDLHSQIGAMHALAEQTGRPILSHSGLKAGEFHTTPREMDYRGSLDAVLDYTLAIHGVPKAVVGASKEYSRANLLGALQSFCSNVINPLLVRYGQHLTQGLARDFDDKLVIHFAPCIVDDDESIRKDFDMLARYGAITANEMRELVMDMTPFKSGGDLPIVQGSQAEATWGNDPDAIVPPEEEEPQVAPAPGEKEETVEESGKDGAGTGTQRRPPFNSKAPKNGKPEPKAKAAQRLERELSRYVEETWSR